MTYDILKNINLTGHVLIRDKDTNEVLFDGFNSIHYGNMARIVGQALTNGPNAFIHYMAFGNGATSVDTAGRIVYKTPRVTETFESGANLYSRTYAKVISAGNDDPTNNRIEVITGPSYTDLKCVCTLSYGEPEGQDQFDSSTTNEGEYIFDELALFSFPTDPSDQVDPVNTSTMLTHVVFHPVQKSQNRVIEIIYTIRIQLS